MWKKFFEIIFKIVNAVLITILILLTLIAFFKPELIERFLSWLEEIIYLLWNRNYLIAFLTAFLESFPVLWVVLPWQNIMLLVWGFFGVQNSWIFTIMILISIIWALLWNYIWYFLWIYYWNSFFEKYWDWFWMGKTEVKYMSSWIKKHWWWMIVVGKFHNLARAFVPFIAGSMWMKSKSFWIFNLIWSVLRASIIIVLWVFFASYYEIFIEYIRYILLFLMVLVGLYIYFFKKESFKKYWKEKEQELENKINKKK